MSSDLPVAMDLLCERCGYMLRGLPESGNCPECGRAIAQSTGGHRRPSAFEAMPSIASLVTTALAVLFRPGHFFSQLATRPIGTRADWFARCHRFIAAALLSVSACGLVIIDHSFPTWLRGLGWRPDEPEVFGLMLAPVMVVKYIVIVLASRAGAMAIAAIASDRPSRLAPAVLRRAMCFHSVHLVPAAFLVAVAVGGSLALLITPMAVVFYLVVARVTVWLAGGSTTGQPFRRIAGGLAFAAMALVVAWYFSEFGGPRFDRVGEPPANWQTYRYAVIGAVIVTTGYLMISGWIAIRNMMYANDAIGCSH